MPRSLALWLCLGWLPAPLHGQTVSVAPFAADVTPPIGSPLCDGLVLPARKIVDRLAARGVVILGAGRPIVLCALDWVGVGNAGHRAWRQGLADAAGTTIDRVCVHALHPHDAPGCDFAAEELLAAHGLAGKMFPVAFARTAIARTAAAVRAALGTATPVTHLAIGQAKVERVASNRRILGTDGKVAHVRFSKSTDPRVRAAPEGVIDPLVKVVGFLRGDQPVAVLSYYATHPQSYYGSGGVSPDFVGLARNLCDAEVGAGRWIHFNGASGNVAAGKYNDGQPARRAELTQRLADGMRAAWRTARRRPLSAATIALRTVPVALPPAPALTEANLLTRLGNRQLNTVERIRAARDLVWLRRTVAGDPVELSCLAIGDVRILHLPGELFVEYQLFAAGLRPDLQVCTAAYGDYGPGYVGTAIAYSQGGYETGKVSRVAPAVEPVLRAGIRQLLADPATPFLAGAATVTITPKEPIRLAGYASRTQPSDGVLQDLHAKALALVGPDGGRALLITADLLGITAAMAERVCKRLADDLRLPRAAILLATSHTHTAPALTDHLPPMAEFDAEERQRVDRYTRWVEDRCVAVAHQAFGALAPAALAWRHGRCDFAVNRRNNREDQVAELRAAGKLRGPVDHDVPVLRITGTDGRLRAVVFGYACHCTVLNSRQISGDYAGFAQRTLESRHPGAVALFVAGCGGDQNPLPRRQVALARRYGLALADSVQAVLRGEMTALRGPLRTAFERTPLGFERIPTAAELRTTLDHDNVYERRRARWLLDQLQRAGELPTHYPYPVQAWRLGDALTWVALGGEATVDYSLAIKKLFGGKRTWVAAYCNDVMGYIPSARVWQEGGYEGAGAMVYYGQPSRWRADVEGTVLAAVKRVVAGTLADELPRIPPQTPAQARATFEVAAGLAVELVAAEPQVADPVDMAFDAGGDLWVVEMRDYPFDEREGHQPAGRVRVLRDADGDGHFEDSRVFADQLGWPTAIALWQGGAFVVAAPDLLYLKDTTGDGRADHREVVFTGFGRRNVQTLANNLVLQPDGWFYGAGGGNGGRITSRRRADVRPVLLRGRDFRFHPDGRFEARTGGGQFGHSIDDFGRRFVCNNSDHARHVVFDAAELARNPRVVPPAPIVSIATEGGSGPVFRRSPPEPWRVVRTRLRVGGQVGGPVEHGGAVTGYFTSATGITVYRGHALPDSYGDLIIGDVASNLIHQKRLSPHGVSFRATRARPGRELLASSDIWFRPTNFADGPDGALYVCDMYREVVEHPWSLPDEIKSNLDLMSGNDRGRIWRLRATDAPRYRKPDLRGATAERLVAALDHPDGWWRDTAARLLLERRDPRSAGLLRARLQTGCSAAGHALMLRLLATLGGITAAHLDAGLAHPTPAVREVAVRIAAAAGHPLAAVANDPDPRVRLQLAIGLGGRPATESLPLLTALAVRDGADPVVRSAVLAAVPPTRLVELLTAGSERSVLPGPVVHDLCAALPDGRQALDYIRRGPHRFAAVHGIATGIERARGDFQAWLAALGDAGQPIRDTLAAAARSAADPNLAPNQRLAAVDLVRRQPFAASRGGLLALLGPRHPPALQTAAIAALGSYPEPAAARALLADWRDRSPAQRRAIVDALSVRTSHARVLLDHLADGGVRASDLTPHQVRVLRSSGDPEVRRRATALTAATDPDRAALIARYARALGGAADATRGQKVFEQHCRTCHRRGADGGTVGPDLATVRERTPRALLEQILDPSREVNPAYLLYIAVTNDGRTIAGSIRSESDSAVTLQTADGKAVRLPRAAIASLETAGLSLMPDGLEATIPPQAMADLIAFLRKG